jgi:hypothetical protein
MVAALLFLGAAVAGIALMSALGCFKMSKLADENIKEIRRRERLAGVPRMSWDRSLGNLDQPKRESPLCLLCKGRHAIGEGTGAFPCPACRTEAYNGWAHIHLND